LSIEDLVTLKISGEPSFDTEEDIEIFGLIFLDSSNAFALKMYRQRNWIYQPINSHPAQNAVIYDINGDFDVSWG
jgi:hypothetical protein